MILGISGKIEHGKDTVGDYLVRHYNFTRVASGDFVKQTLEMLDPFIYSMNDYLNLLLKHAPWESLKHVEEIRHLLNIMGNDIGRNFFGEDSWIKKSIEKIEKEKIKDVVITDVRYPNEVRYIERKGGIVLRVERPNHILPAHDYPAEKALDSYKFNHLLLNNGTITQLHRKIDTFIDNRLLRKSRS